MELIRVAGEYAMVKWPFRRKNEESAEQPEYQVPSEIQDYYQAERRERSGVAWLMATGTLVVTVLLAVGLFFGGRWVYRKVANKDTKSVANNSNVQQTTTDNQPQIPQTSSTSTSQPSATTTTPAPTATTPPVSTPSPTPSSTPPPTPAATPTPSTLGATTQTSLPNTGPIDIVAAVVLATILGTVSHYLMTRRYSSR